MMPKNDLTNTFEILLRLFNCKGNLKRSSREINYKSSCNRFGFHLSQFQTMIFLIYENKLAYIYSSSSALFLREVMDDQLKNMLHSGANTTGKMSISGIDLSEFDLVFVKPDEMQDVFQLTDKILSQDDSDVLIANIEEYILLYI